MLLFCCCCCFIFVLFFGPIKIGITFHNLELQKFIIGLNSFKQDVGVRVILTNLIIT